MTHHFGDRPERPGSLFEKPEPREQESAAEDPGPDAPTDRAAEEETPAGEGSVDEAADAPGEGGRTAAPTPDARGSERRPTAVDDAAGTEAADTAGTAAHLDGGRDAPGYPGGVGDAPGAAGHAPEAVREQATGAADGDDVGRAAPAANRGAVDPFATAPMPATRPSGRLRPSAVQAAAPPAVDRFAATQPATARSGAQAPMDESRGDDQPTTHFGSGPGHTAVDEAPTEALPVVGAAGGRPGADDDAVAEWRPPRQTSRLTTILIIALLIAVGFLAGVFVGRAAAPAPTSGEQPRPAATSSARPAALG